MACDDPLDPIEDTALLQAFWRVEEGLRSAPRLRDPVARQAVATLMEPARRADLAPTAQLYGEIHIASVLACDREIARWATTVGRPGQVVVLGCGFDGRPAREPVGSKTRFFMVDRRRVLDRLAGLGPAPSQAVTLVEADLARPDALFGKLTAMGWDRTVPTAFVAEGVAEFLGEAGTRRLIAATRARAASGSLLLVQILDPGIVPYAAERGDTTFPWRRLPDPAEALGPLPEGAARRVADAGPIGTGPATTPLSHVFAVAM